MIDLYNLSYSLILSEIINCMPQSVNYIFDKLITECIIHDSLSLVCIK